MEKVAAIMTRHWKPLVLFNLLVLVAAIGKFATTPKAWTATAQLIMPNTTGNLDANLGTLGSLKNSDPSFSTQVNPLKVQESILTSEALLEKVWAVDPENKKTPKPRNYGNFFEILPQEQSTIISLAVSGSSPEVARQRTIALTTTYQQRLNELRQADRTYRQQFSEKELEQARSQLSQTQEMLARFKASTGLVNSEAQTEGLVTTMNQLVASQAETQAEAKASRDRAKVLSERLSLTPVQAIRSLGLGENQDYQYVRNKLAEVEASLVKMRSTFTDNHPGVQTLFSQRNELQRQLQEYVTRAAAGAQVDTTVVGGSEGRATLIQQLIVAESEASSQQRQADQLQKKINQLNADLKSLPVNQAQLLELQRQADVAEGVYKGLVAQVQRTNIDAFNAYPNVQLLDPPKVDSKATSPKKSLVALNAVLASIVGSVALVLLLERRNPLLSPKDLQSVACPIAVTIPRLKHSNLRLELATETEVEFQRLASAISLQSLSDHRLLVTSAIAGEGKTIVTLNLAKALVDLGFRVLIVDGDFRKAELSRRLGCGREVMAMEMPVPLQPNLDLLPTLPKQSRVVEWVRQGRFEQSLAAAQSAGDYDYILIDTAPVSQTSETALMATLVPNVLFIVRPGTSKSNSVSTSLDLLTQHKANILGLAINGVDASSRSETYRSNGSLVKS